MPITLDPLDCPCVMRDWTTGQPVGETQASDFQVSNMDFE
jgi:hypothetical protein